MLTPHEIARFLGHERKPVRDHALRSLAFAGEHGQAGTEAALEVLGRLGQDAFSQPKLIAQLVQTDKTVERAIAGVRESRGVFREACGEILLELPQQMLQRVAGQVGQLPAGELRQRLESRLRLVLTPPDERWRIAPNSKDAVLTLVAHDAAVAPLVADALVRPGHSHELCALELAGRIHLGTVLPQVVDRLSSSNPQVAEMAARALGYLGTTGAVTLLEQRCNLSSATVTFRLNAAKALMHFRVPSAEAMTLRLLAEEDDVGVQKALCTALALMGTTMGEAKLAETARRLGDRGVVDAVAALEVMLHAPPVAKPGPQAAPVSAEVVTTNAFASSGAVAGEGEAAPAGKVAPIRAEAKVGRNDPCPCGSGKKYKKCCGA